MTVTSIVVDLHLAGLSLSVTVRVTVRVTVYVPAEL